MPIGSSDHLWSGPRLSGQPITEPAVNSTVDIQDGRPSPLACHTDSEQLVLPVVQKTQVQRCGGRSVVGGLRRLKAWLCLGLLWADVSPYEAATGAATSSKERLVNGSSG